MLKVLAIHPPRTAVFLGLGFALVMLTAIGCSSGSPDTPAATAEPTAKTLNAEPTQAAAPTQLPAPTAVTDAEPTPTTVPTPSPVPGTVKAGATVAPASTSTPLPISTPTPTSTPTPVPLTNVYDLYGFSVELDQDSSFQTADLIVKGWTGTRADNEQGIMSFNYNGTNIVIFWQPQAGDTPQSTVDLAYEVQKASKPELNFVPISEGEITVDGQSGRFGGYLTTESSGANASGGLIGAWTCEESGTQISLTASGKDATALQIRFDRLTSGFKCVTS